MTMLSDLITATIESMRIFLSYASENRHFAEAVAVALRERGVHVFFDREALPAGEEYHNRIQTAIDKANLFIALVSDAYLADGRYAMTELNAALARWDLPSRGILPVDIGLTDVAALPSKLSQVTLLKPRGNPTADVVQAAIEKCRQEVRRRAVLPLLIAFVSLALLCVLSWVIPIDLPGAGFAAVAMLRIFATTAFVAVTIAAPILWIPYAAAQLFLGLIPLAATLFVSAVLWFALDLRPATDSNYAGTNKIKIIVWERGSPIPAPQYQETLGSSGGRIPGVRFLPELQEPSEERSLAKLVFTLPTRAKVGDEVLIRLEMKSRAPSTTTGRVAELSTNDRLAVTRQASDCQFTEMYKVSCASTGPDFAPVSWALRALAPGSNQLALRFTPPAQVLVVTQPLIYTASKNGASRFEDAASGREITTLSSVREYKSVESDTEARFMRYHERVVTDVADVDLVNGVLEFRFDVLDTMGVTRGAYNAMTLTVAATAGIVAGTPVWLGLLKLLKYLSRRLFGVGRGKDLATTNV